MADLIIPNGYANVTWIFSLSGVSHQFSFSHGVNFGSFLTFDCQEIADDAAHAFNTGYGMANAYNAWTFVRTHVIAQDGGDLFSADSEQNIAGSGGGGSVNTPNLAMIVKKGTGRAGKHFRGRMFWPCLSLLDADVDNAGNIAPAVLATIDANVQDFFLQWQAEDTVTAPVLLHASSPPSPTVVTTWQTEALCGTQRRRMR